MIDGQLQTTFVWKNIGQTPATEISCHIHLKSWLELCTQILCHQTFAVHCYSRTPNTTRTNQRRPTPQCHWHGNPNNCQFWNVPLTTNDNCKNVSDIASQRHLLKSRIEQENHCPVHISPSQTQLFSWAWTWPCRQSQWSQQSRPNFQSWTRFWQWQNVVWICHRLMH